VLAAACVLVLGSIRLGSDASRQTADEGRGLGAEGALHLRGNKNKKFPLFGRVA
jgi:hypothetical protein